MVTCRRFNAMGDVVRVWGPAKTTGVSVCPAESAPVPITDTTYDNHHRPTRVTQYLAAAGTALDHAAQNGLAPSQMGVSRPICPTCKAAIESSGGTLTSPTTAVWPR
jgi:hypothetical protein